MKTTWLLFFSLAFISFHTVADYRDDIGYSTLQAKFASALADGSGVNVSHVEAAFGADDNSLGAWFPDISEAQFSGKSIVDQTTPGSDGISSHATGVARFFYGNIGSIAPGISNISVFSADPWIEDGFLNTSNGEIPGVSSSRVNNHSWIGFIGEDDDENVIDPIANSSALRRVDWQAARDEAIHVVGMGNGTTNQPLLGSAYNVIAVGRTDAIHGLGSFALDNVYAAGRVRPDAVVPQTTTSNATPIVSATAALLIEQAHQDGIVASAASTANRNGDVIYNGERTEVVKAVIMAGADRETNNTSNDVQINNYREDAVNQSENGLDKRYGAGQVNVYNSYNIVLAGEQDSLEDGGGVVDQQGYDYDDSFGGADNSNETGNYFFSTGLIGEFELAAALVWNIAIAGENGAEFDETATLYDLDLLLFDVTDNNETLLASSESVSDNTENIWLALQGGHDYQLQVTKKGSEPFNWDYALAWQVTAVPVPASIWFFITGLSGIFGFARLRFL